MSPNTLLSQIDAAHAAWKLGELDGDTAAMEESAAQLEHLAKQATAFAFAQANRAVRRLRYDALVEVARDVPRIGVFVQSPWV